MSPTDPVSPPLPSPPVALILGITGGLGRAIAVALAQRGWAIRALSRRPADRRPLLPYPVEWQMGDALDAASVRQAAEGATLILHGVNPPDYQRWREDGLPMLAHTIAAAKESGATILFPANVYVFSSASPPRLDENAAREPKSRKGQVRLEMEQMLEQAAKEHGIRVIALRAGDFFGPGVTNSWFAQAMAKGGFSAKVLQTLTPPGIAHAWAYVPDLAEAFARLVERRQTLPPFTLVHFAGHADMTGRDMAEAVARAIGRKNLPIRPFPWFMLWLGAPFVPFLREALEMRWLWKTSLTLENGQLRRLIGEEPHTPLDDAVRAALATAP
ncbi:MAG: sugar nucleotide-binding protein [Methylobacterium sp.]|nr:sugar nucleotide-binding protein [Rhodobacter sp.]MCA3648125.1 sugar nucleotide-binding protein [Methylobacterium sp.]MCA3654166.1 sugar nucleotide-binding protein [Methylobacterium sp.]MCA3656995.1 sugar nucleotide-binding protein [Methylobacterium sp.]MCA3661932.1 sugar nucleotide-binding protein [Methylobacterium sp.]